MDNNNTQENHKIPPILKNVSPNPAPGYEDKYGWFSKQRSYPKIQGKTDHWAALADHVTDCNDRLNKLEKQNRTLDTAKVKKGLEIQMTSNIQSKQHDKQQEKEFMKRMINEDIEKFKSEQVDKVKKVATMKSYQKGHYENQLQERYKKIEGDKDEKMNEKVGDHIAFNEYTDPKNNLRRNKRMLVDIENKKVWDRGVVNKSFTYNSAVRNKMAYLTEKFNDLDKQNQLKGAYKARAKTESRKNSNSVDLNYSKNKVKLDPISILFDEQVRQANTRKKKYKTYVADLRNSMEDKIVYKKNTLLENNQEELQTLHKYEIENKLMKEQEINKKFEKQRKYASDLDIILKKNFKNNSLYQYFTSFLFKYFQTTIFLELFFNPYINKCNG